MKKTPSQLPGRLSLHTIRMVVLSIVGAELDLPVFSGGDQFFMAGNFPFRAVLSNFADRPPTPAEIKTWAAGAHLPRVNPFIMVAEAPASTNSRTHLAIRGGAAHEALHRLLTRQSEINPTELRAALQPMFVHPTTLWSRYLKLVQDMQNVLEDIWIERIGCELFPGIQVKLNDLTDFILAMENENRSRTRNPIGPETAAFSFLREYGLGYNTDTVQARLEEYRAAQPRVAAMFAPGGELSNLLRRSIPKLDTEKDIELARKALLGGAATRLALEWVAALDRLSVGKPAEENPQPQPNAGAPQPGSGQGQPQPGNSQPGPRGPQPSGATGDSKLNPGSNDPAGGNSSRGSGGGASADVPPDARALVAAILAGHRSKGSGLLDGSSALTQAVREKIAADFRRCPSGKKPWSPATTARDEKVPARIASYERAGFEECVEKARVASLALRTQFRIMFQAQEQTWREHGVRRGKGLSERRIVDTALEFLSGEEPTRPDYVDEGSSREVSVSSVFVLDESSSMDDNRREAMGAAYALGSALEGISAPFMVEGFRRCDGSVSLPAPIPAASLPFHRSYPIAYDIFKDWDQSWREAAPTLLKWRATGTTPMSDGIEFALQELSRRNEGYRLMFIFTDGEPDSDHVPVIRDQLDRAAAAGILVIGVGLGDKAKYVTGMFPHHVWASDIAALPRPLVAKLRELVLGKGLEAKRGRKVAPAA